MRDFVAVTDSGVGGITTLSQIIKEVGGYDLWYFGDREFAPYGDKSRGFIFERMNYITKRFFSMGARAVVIACNTATNACIDLLRQENDGIIVGTEPAVKKTARLRGKTALLVTPVTARQQKFISLMESCGSRADVFALPDMAPLIENNINDLDKAKNMIEDRLSFLSDYDNAVLGCTHYVFLKPYISAFLPQLKLFDGNEGVAKRLKTLLPPSPCRGGAIRFIRNL